MVNRRNLLKASVLTAAGCASAKLGADLPQSISGAEGSARFLPVHPGIWKARIGTPEAYTHVSGRTVPPDEKGIRELPAVHEAPFGSMAGKVDSRGCLLSLPLDAHEEIFGFGLQLLSFAQRGKKKTIRVNADPKVDTGDSHAPVPFYVSTKGYGVLVDTCRYASFYCGDARLKPSGSGTARKSGKLQTPNPTRNLSAEDPGRVLVDVPRATGVDVYVFAGPTMLDAVRRYNLFSGGGVEPPEWGLGFWYRVVGTANAAEALSIARGLRDSKIPCDVLGLEPGWQSHAYSCSFAWDSGDDQKLHAVDDEYMMGDRILVAPLFAGEESREVTLPTGVWHDFWTGNQVQGVRSHTISSGQLNIPVFVKAGSIVPLGGVGLTTEAESTRDLTIAVFGDGSKPWRLEGDSGFELRKSASGRIEAKSLGTKPHGYRVGEIRQMGND